MISFTRGDSVFNYRVAAIIVQREQVLLVRLAGEDFWFLPGGRVEQGESAADALRRELREELDVAITVERLLWVAESFFSLGGRTFHEIALYFLVMMPRSTPLLQTGATFYGPEGNQQTFRWYPVATLKEVTLYPAFLRKGLGAIPEHTVHVVERDDQEQE
jgi:ADP-ribose pyrophosphatase YjhB (NUDIX family)